MSRDFQPLAPGVRAERNEIKVAGATDARFCKARGALCVFSASISVKVNRILRRRWLIGAEKRKVTNPLYKKFYYFSCLAILSRPFARKIVGLRRRRRFFELDRFKTVQQKLSRLLASL